MSHIIMNTVSAFVHSWVRGCLFTVVSDREYKQRNRIIIIYLGIGKKGRVDCFMYLATKYNLM